MVTIDGKSYGLFELMIGLELMWLFIKHAFNYLLGLFMSAFLTVTNYFGDIFSGIIGFWNNIF